MSKNVSNISLAGVPSSEQMMVSWLGIYLAIIGGDSSMINDRVRGHFKLVGACQNHKEAIRGIVSRLSAVPISDNRELFSLITKLQRRLGRLSLAEAA
ncbi:hypothetical protein [Hahella ganghwensis]|uniref:hypothetical protein n=1 Tax=Hahella ganghwensis TaxID=286420 RepID=UPI0003615167|nr:hypothetical protein [Hahella ganghwensis]